MLAPDFERIDSGRFILVHRKLKLRELLHAAQSVFATQALANGVSLTFEELPSSLAEAAFVGDLPRLTQVLSNGISNAIKFTEKGGNVRVSVMQSDNHARKGWSQLRVCVADDGIGLDARELATLRDGGVFTQVGMGQLQGRGGTGLGLNIARHILAAHHCSELKLTSAGHGKGATFEMLANLPHAGTPFADAILSPLNDSNVSERALAALTSSLAAPHRAVAAGELCMRCRLRAQCEEMQRLELKGPAAGLAAPLLAEVACLHVEVCAALMPLLRCAAAHCSARPLSVIPACPPAQDDKLLQRTIGIRLRKLDVTVVIATNGREALENVMLRQADGLPPFSLVVMDNQMPVMNGATATAALRSGGFAGFILGMTGVRARCVCVPLRSARDMRRLASLPHLPRWRSARRTPWAQPIGPSLSSRGSARAWTRRRRACAPSSTSCASSSRTARRAGPWRPRGTARGNKVISQRRQGQDPRLHPTSTISSKRTPVQPCVPARHATLPSLRGHQCGLHPQLAPSGRITAGSTRARLLTCLSRHRPLSSTSRQL